MKRRWRIAGWIALALVAVLGYVTYRTVWGKPFSINMLANRQALEFLMRNPELFTTVGIAEGSVFDHHSDKLTPFTVKERDADYALLARFLKEVHQFDRARLGRQDQITYDILVDQYESGLAFQPFDWVSPDGIYAISPMFGDEATLPGFMQTTHIIKNEKTAANYVKRLEAMAVKLDEITADMQRQAHLGVVLPPALLEHSLTVIHDSVASKPEDNPMVTTFVTRMEQVKGLDAARKQQLRAAAIAALGTQVYPAYARMSAALEAMRPQSASQGAGVARLPDGASYYALALKQQTTTDYSPEKVHELGLAEVARISKEMDALLQAQGMAAGSVGERMHRAARGPALPLPRRRRRTGRRPLARYQQILDEVNARMPEYFRYLPTNDRLTVERVPTSQENGTSGAYYQQAAMDGSRPGIFFANLRDMKEVPQWGMKTLAYHEGIPGHHFQSSISLALKDLPLIRQQTLYAAYAEGWAPVRRAAGGRDRHVQGRPVRRTSGVCSWSCCAPDASSSIPAFTPRAGRASRRSTTWSTRPA